MIPSGDIAAPLEIMAALRTPVTGCAWDLEQTSRTLAPFAIEEAHEVVDAIERGDPDDLRDELGDLLLQVVFHAQIAREAGHFAFEDVVRAISTKMIRRHPHVFGDGPARSPAEVQAVWSAVKAQEKAERARRRGDGEGLLGAVPAGRPALARAVALQAKAATVGFDWDDAHLVIAKIREELDEVEAALGVLDQDAVVDEVGDVLFAMANLARHLRVDPEAALRGSNAKFIRRFRFIERTVDTSGGTLETTPLAEMESLRQAAKAAERA